MKKHFLAAATAAACAMSAPVSAATVTIENGQTFCESYSRLDALKGTCDLTQSSSFDLDNHAPHDDSLAFAGSGSLTGYVKTPYSDFANISLAFDSIVTLTLFEVTESFAGLFSFGDAYSDYQLSEGDTVSFKAAAGSYDFGIEALGGESRYTLEVAAVPLPAGVFLLLGGLGGLAAIRRKSS